MQYSIKNIWRLLYPFVIYIAASYLVQYVYAAWYVNMQKYKFGINVTEDELIVAMNNDSIGITLAINALLIPIFIYFVIHDKKDFASVHWQEYEFPKIKEWIIIALLGMSSAIAINALIAVSGVMRFSTKYHEVSQAIYSGGMAWELISAGVLAPLLEELFFRGLIYRRIREYLDAKWAIIISAALFGAFHGNLVQFLYAFIVGCVLAFVLEKYKAVFAPIVFHMASNIISILITELVPAEMITETVLIMALGFGIIIMAFLLFCVNRYEAKKKVIRNGV